MNEISITFYSGGNINVSRIYLYRSFISILSQKKFCNFYKVGKLLLVDHKYAQKWKISSLYAQKWKKISCLYCHDRQTGTYRLTWRTY